MTPRSQPISMSINHVCLVVFMCFSLLASSFHAFQSDELLADDEEFGLVGGQSTDAHQSKSNPSIRQTSRSSGKRSSDLDSDSKVQFPLEHAFGDSDFSSAGTFTARIKTSSNGGQTLTKLRFSREDFTNAQKEKFKELLENDDFYRIRVPSNVLNQPGREYIFSSVKARCLPRGSLDEHFVIHMEGINILAINYGSPGACIYPRPLTLPSKWVFSSYTILKSSEQAPRTPSFIEEAPGVGDGEGGEGVKPIERSFWAKYWMYLIPLGLIVMNAVTQAANMPEEQAGGQPGSASSAQQAPASIQRGPSSNAVRRR
ncbi:ER membrane protein complex subunit 10 [Impatiens glandulifera]|uniref:ER membrane protein complex subunit 10 n=1 Tax=Impatiens glandulifera TaxID=253017 RepID=UPI001FB09453|nr:ER membrane protein complex subunit 10 [Impatiens glandulifera]